MVALGNSNVTVTEPCPSQSNQSLVKEETEDSEKPATLINVTDKCTDSFPCHVCGKYFAHGSSLYRHEKSAHPQLQSGNIFWQEKTVHFYAELCKNFEVI